MVEAGMTCVWKLTSVPSMSKNNAFVIMFRLFVTKVNKILIFVESKTVIYAIVSRNTPLH